MNFNEYEEMIRNMPYTATLEYQLAIMWLHPDILPLGVTSIGNTDSSIIKIPSRTKNQYGKIVPVIAISKHVFAGKDYITDIVLPPGIERLPAGAFAECRGLKRITIPQKVKTIKKGTFAGCNQLEDVYYEGTKEEWKKLNIVHQKHEIAFGDLIPGTPVHEIKAERILHIPGNEALFAANIHFLCKLSDQDVNSSFGLCIGKEDITDFFRII